MRLALLMSVLLVAPTAFAKPDKETTESATAILERLTKRLGISVGAVRTERVGLRPYRAEVRLERDHHHRRVIHNYGHCGAGFTLCRGCAEDVVALLH